MHEFLVLVEHFDVVFLLYVPYKNSFVHSGRNQKARVVAPLEVEDVFRVAHQSAFSRPSHNFLRAVDGETILPFLPNGDAFVI